MAWEIAGVPACQGAQRRVDLGHRLPVQRQTVKYHQVTRAAATLDIIDLATGRGEPLLKRLLLRIDQDRFPFTRMANVMRRTAKKTVSAILRTAETPGKKSVRAQEAPAAGVNCWPSSLVMTRRWWKVASWAFHAHNRILARAPRWTTRERDARSSRPANDHGRARLGPSQAPRSPR